MARNKAQKPLTEAPPAADSSDESATTSSQEEPEESADNSGSDSDEEQTPSTPQIPPASGKKAPTSAAASASASAAPTAVASGNKRALSEDDSTSDDDEDEPTLHKIKPISKPGFISGTLGNDKLTYTIAALPAGKNSGKRASESSSKKPRKEKSGSVAAAVAGGAGGGVQEEGSKKLFQRVFSEDDEILILKGMIDFKAKRGADPMIEIDDFYGFIKKSLHVEVSKVQIVDKVRRLKKKFFNAKKKKLTNPIEIQCFELSKKIWENNYSDVGDDVVVEDDKGTNGAVAETNNGNVGSKSNSKARVLKIKSGANAGAVVEDQKKKNDKEEEVIVKSGKVVENNEKDMELEVGEAVAWEELRKKGLKMMGAKARAEIGEMWEKVAMKQAEARIMRSEAEQEETRRIIEALRSGKH